MRCLAVHRSAALGIALGIILALGACGGNKGPGQTLDRYGRALKNRDYASAYELMSSGFRGKVSREDYIRMMRDNPREVDETASRLRGKRGSLEVSAEFEYGFGDRMLLVQEDGRWRIASNPLGFYDQSTPRNALRGFLRAYRLERWDIMMRFVPNAYREKMDEAKMKAQFTGPSREQLENLINTLEANVDEPIIERGNDAKMSYGDRFEVRFVKEDGAWKLKFDRNVYGTREAFDGMPARLLERVLRRLYDVLIGSDTRERFAGLSPEDRRSTLEIVRETKAGLPPYWQPSESGH